MLDQTILIVWKHSDFLCVSFIFNLQFCFNHPNIIGNSKLTSMLFFENSSRNIMFSNMPVGIIIRKTNYPFVMNAFQLSSVFLEYDVKLMTLNVFHVLYKKNVFQDEWYMFYNHLNYFSFLFFLFIFYLCCVFLQI